MGKLCSLSSPEKGACYLHTRRGFRGVELKVSNMLLRARCWSWEVAGNTHKHQFPPCFLFLLSSLGTSVFLGWFSEVPVDWRGSLSTWLQQSGLSSWVSAAPSYMPKSTSGSRPAPLQGKGTHGFKIRGLGSTDWFSASSHVCSTFAIGSFPFNNTVSWKHPLFSLLSCFMAVNLHLNCK